MTVGPRAVLLDTCALIWLANAGPLGAGVIQALAHAALDSDLLVSPVSAWEIGLLDKKHGPRSSVLLFAPDVRTWLATAMAAPGVRIATFTPAIALAVSSLPGILHSDPADRMLISTARHLDVPIVTSDRKIIDYGAQGLVKVLPC